jgi:hypothetical protein
VNNGNTRKLQIFEINESRQDRVTAHSGGIGSNLVCLRRSRTEMKSKQRQDSGHDITSARFIIESTMAVVDI